MYLNKRNEPKHWKGKSVFKPNRNGRKYVKTMNPGKPLGLSAPLSLIIQRYFNDPSHHFRTLRSMRVDLRINGHCPKDLRAPVMVGDLVKIRDDEYLFLIKKTPKKGLSFVLEQVNKEFIGQKTIRQYNKKKGELELLNGQRRRMTEEDIRPGSIWLPGKGIVKPLQVKRLIRLTGSKKFRIYQVVGIELKDENTVFSIQDPEQETREKVNVSWEDLRLRKYLLLA